MWQRWVSNPGSGTQRSTCPLTKPTVSGITNQPNLSWTTALDCRASSLKHSVSASGYLAWRDVTHLLYPVGSFLARAQCSDASSLSLCWDTLDRCECKRVSAFPSCETSDTLSALRLCLITHKRWEHPFLTHGSLGGVRELIFKGRGHQLIHKAFHKWYFRPHLDPSFRLCEEVDYESVCPKVHKIFSFVMMAFFIPPCHEICDGWHRDMVRSGTMPRFDIPHIFP